MPAALFALVQRNHEHAALPPRARFPGSCRSLHSRAGMCGRACGRAAGSRSRSISYGALSSRPGHARPRRQGSEHQPARVTLTRCCWPRTRLLVPLCFYQSPAVRPALDRLLPSLARAARPPAHQLPACRFHQPCACVNQTKGRSTGRGLAEHGVAKTKLWPVGYKSL